MQPSSGLGGVDRPHLVSSALAVLTTLIWSRRPRRCSPAPCSAVVLCSTVRVCSDFAVHFLCVRCARTLMCAAQRAPTLMCAAQRARTLMCAAQRARTLMCAAQRARPLMCAAQRTRTMMCVVQWPALWYVQRTCMWSAAHPKCSTARVRSDVCSAARDTICTLICATQWPAL